MFRRQLIKLAKQLYPTGRAMRIPTSAEVGFNITSSVYSGEFLNVSAQDNLPTGLVFNNDGSKVFIIGNSNDTVYAYDLSITYNVSTGVYNGDFFDIGSQEQIGEGIAFNNDGSKMFTIGNQDKRIYAYDLGTNFDISTAVYNGVFFGVSTQSTSPTDLTFNSTGTKVYITGSSNASVYTYDLGTNFDVSTAVYNGEFFDTDAEEDSPQGLIFKSDGSKIYITGSNEDKVFAYDLGTNFDVSTAVYNEEFFDVSGQEATPLGITINSLDSKLYIVGPNDVIYAYEIANRGSVKERLHSALAIDENNALEFANNILNSILPDNNQFSEEDATLWEKRLGLVINSHLTLEERKTAILRKMQYPNGILARQHHLYIEHQLQLAGFDVYVHENRFLADPIINEQMGLMEMGPGEMGGEIPNPNKYEVIDNDQFTNPKQMGLMEMGSGEMGGAELLYTIIANYIEEELDADFIIEDQSIGAEMGTAEMGTAEMGSVGLTKEQFLRATFFIGGETFPNRAEVPPDRKKEFRELILKLKPAHSLGFLLIDYV